MKLKNQRPGPKWAVETVKKKYVKSINYDDYHLPEDDNHHSHRRGNLKSYTV
jgi:hypothetical protein